MKIIHALAIAAGMTTLAACGGGTEAEENTALEANNLVVDDMSNTDMNMDMNMDVNMDANMDMNGDMNVDANADANAAGNTTNTY